MVPEPPAAQRLCLVGLSAPGLALTALAEALSRRVALPCVLVPDVPAPALPVLPGRDQWDARALLDWLAARREPHELTLAITGRDLGLPVFSHVFGLAEPGARVAVIALARLDPAFEGLPADPRLWLRRAVAEALHELGHIAGLGHCRAPDCVMRFAGTVAKADARGGAFCAACRASLPAWLRPPSPAYA